MKTYLPPRELLARIDAQALAAKPRLAPRGRRPRLAGCAEVPPLERIASLLQQGRHYFAVTISLQAGNRLLRQAHCGSESGETRSELAAPIKIAGHVLGVIEVKSGRPDPLGAQDRVLLKGVAARLARFLTGRGKYLLRKAREAAEPAPAPPGRMRAAAGVKSRP